MKLSHRPAILNRERNEPQLLEMRIPRSGTSQGGRFCTPQAVWVTSSQSAKPVLILHVQLKSVLGDLYPCTFGRSVRAFRSPKSTRENLPVLILQVQLKSVSIILNPGSNLPTLMFMYCSRSTALEHVTMTATALNSFSRHISRRVKSTLESFLP